MKDAGKNVMETLFDALPPEKAAEALRGDDTAAAVSAERVKELVRRGLPREKKKKKWLRFGIAAAAAAACMTVGTFAVTLHFRSIRVEAPETVTTILPDGSEYVYPSIESEPIRVVTFEREPDAIDRKTNLFAIRPGELPVGISDVDSSDYESFLAFRLQDKDKREDAEGNLNLLTPEELKNRFDARLADLEGTYWRICMLDYPEILNTDGYPVSNTRIYNLEIHSGNELDLSFVITGDAQTEKTTFDGHQALRISMTMDYVDPALVPEGTPVGQHKILLVYYEEQDAVVAFSECMEYGEVTFKELEEIARGVTLVDSGVDSANLPYEMPGVLHVSTARG